MIPFPNKKYQIIYADPPWDIGTINLKKWKSPLSSKYFTMKLEEIKELPVKGITAEDCGLFLWTTHTFLGKAFEVIMAWGFKYHCCITWNKCGGWCCNGFYRQTEFCLFGYKGKLNINQKGKFIPTLITEKKREHSRKPEIMRKWINDNTPEPRVELFARPPKDLLFEDESYKGWDLWGNEV